MSCINREMNEDEPLAVGRTGLLSHGTRQYTIGNFHFREQRLGWQLLIEKKSQTCAARQYGTCENAPRPARRASQGLDSIRETALFFSGRKAINEAR